MRLLFFLVLLTTSIKAQTIWFNKDGEKTSKDNASFYRPKPKSIRKGFWVIDYYKDGKVMREGFAKAIDNNSPIYNGLVIEYYKNGIPSTRNHYKNGKLNGMSKRYFESGELKIQYRYKNGQPDGVWKEFYKSGKIKTKGKYKDGEKVGVWKTFYKNVYESFLDY